MGDLGRHYGFTLIELMIVLVIASILTVIAIPNYHRYVRNSRRMDGRALLERVASDEQQFYMLYSTYATIIVPASASCSGRSCGLDYASALSPDGYYVLSITPATGGISDGFTLKATPTTKGGQNLDTQCGTLTLSSTGARGFSGTGSQEECWS